MPLCIAPDPADKAAAGLAIMLPLLLGNAGSLSGPLDAPAQPCRLIKAANSVISKIVVLITLLRNAIWGNPCRFLL